MTIEFGTPTTGNLVIQAETPEELVQKIQEEIDPSAFLKTNSSIIVVKGKEYPLVEQDGMWVWVG